MTATTQAYQGKLTKRPFGMRDKIGYMFGDFGNDFTFILQSAFFMLFFTNVVGVDPAHVGLLLLGARLIDGFTDVGMGILVDRLPVRAGQAKFKRWIKYIAIPVAVASALMYMSFAADFDSYALKIVWMTATYLLWGSVAYTAINIPYGSMASVISGDPDDRAQLSVFRSTGATLANLVIMAVLPLVVYTVNADGVAILSGPRMTIAAVVCSVLAVICYAVCYALVDERVPSVVKSKAEGGEGIGKMLGTVVTNKALLGLIVAALLLLITFMFLGGIIGYLFLNYFGNGAMQSPASIAGILPSLALVVISPWLAKKFGKAEVGIVAMLVAGAALVVAYFLQIENPVVWIVFYAIAMFAVQVFNFLIWAFITDVIDFQEVRTGTRDDGTVYAIYSWARKVGQALAGGLIGVALGMIGFDAVAAAAGEAQTEAVQGGIYMLANLVPGIGCILVAVALLFLYPLKKKQVAENVRILADRRAESAEATSAE
ncbi:MFS transporter [Tessaracoccus terricola]